MYRSTQAGRKGMKRKSMDCLDSSNCAECAGGATSKKPFSQKKIWDTRRRSGWKSHKTSTLPGVGAYGTKSRKVLSAKLACVEKNDQRHE